MGLLGNLFKKKPAVKAMEQAVIIHLDGISLPDEVYAECDLATLEDQLEKCLAGGLGELDGHESGPDETVIYLYGANAERIFSAIEPTLLSYPLCQNALVRI